MDAERERQLDVRRPTRAGDDRTARGRGDVGRLLREELAHAEPEIIGPHHANVDRRQDGGT